MKGVMLSGSLFVPPEMEPQTLSVRRQTPLTTVLFMATVVALLLSGCTPTVKVEAPREPITINLNVKLDAEVRLKIEEKAEEDVENNPIF